MPNDVLAHYSNLIRDCSDGNLVLSLAGAQSSGVILLGAMLNSSRHVRSLTLALEGHASNKNEVRSQNKAAAILFHTLARLLTPLCAIRIEGVVARSTRCAIHQYLRVNPRFEKIDFDRTAHTDQHPSETLNIYVGKTLNHSCCGLLNNLGHKPLHLEFWATEEHNELALRLKGNKSIKSLTFSMGHELQSLGLLQVMLSMQDLEVVRMHLDAPGAFGLEKMGLHHEGNKDDHIQQQLSDSDGIIYALCHILQNLPKLSNIQLVMDFSETLNYLSILAPVLRKMKTITLVDRYNGYIEGEEAVYEDALVGNEILEKLVVSSTRYSTWKALLSRVVPTLPNLRLLGWGPSEYELDAELGKHFLKCIKSLGKLSRSDLTCADPDIDGGMSRELLRNRLNQTGLLSKAPLPFYPFVFERFLQKGITSSAFNLMREKCDILVRPAQFSSRNRKRERAEISEGRDWNSRKLSR